jgi:hypothetical protein
VDIHKPKPAHSIPEFLSEIGTITVGILIALSLEAALEAYRGHELVEHAKADLIYELQGNRDALASTVNQERAVMVALDNLAQYGRRRLKGEKVAAPKDLVLVMNFRPMNTAAWDSTVATQALVHMPYAEAQAVSRAYSGSRIFNAFETDAIRHWYEISAFPDDLDSLGKADLTPIVREISLNQAYQASVLNSAQGLLKIYDKALATLK